MKITKTLLIIFLFSGLLFFNGCDDLENFELNIPIEIPIYFDGDDAQDDTYTLEFCLNQYEEWVDNQDKIQKVRYLKAAYWTIGYSPAAIKGDLHFRVTDRFGEILLGGNIEDVSPGDYIGAPLVIEVDSEQIDAFNAYLSEILNKEDPTCQVPTFTAFGAISNIAGTTGSYMVEGKVELVLAAEVEP